MGDGDSYTYAKAGVSIAAGNALVKAIAPLAKSTARPGADASLDANARAAMNTDFVALRNQIAKTIANANFNGANLLKTAAAAIAIDAARTYLDRKLPSLAEQVAAARRVPVEPIDDLDGAEPMGIG